MSSLATRKLGKLTTSALGFGCMGLSEFYGTPLSNTDAIDVIRKAFEAGITHFDTADVYAFGENEEVLGEAVAPFRDQITIATKCGIVRSKTDLSARGVRNNRDYVLNACDASLKRLGVSCIDLFYLHRLAPETPLEESVGALAELVKQGKVRYIGVSEADAKTIEKAHQIHPITAVQSEFSLWARGIEYNNVFSTCQRLGIGIVAYSPLGRGFLTGAIKKADELADTDFRKTLPRFSGDNLDTNFKLVALLEEKAKEKGCTPAQLALAWVLGKGDFIVPIPGTKTPSRILENIAAASVKLDATEMAYLDKISKDYAPKQPRYTEAAMQAYNLSE